MRDENKKEFLKELKSYIKNVVVVMMVSILLYNKISLSTNLLKISDAKISWFIDVGVYSALILAIISMISYWYESKKTMVKVSMYFEAENVRVLKLKGEENKKIILVISISGSDKYIPESIILSYPNWLYFQIDKKDYINVIDDKNQYEINLMKLLSSQKIHNQTKEVPIQVISNTPEKNSIEIIPEFVNEKRKSLFYSSKVEGIKIELRGD